MSDRGSGDRIGRRAKAPALSTAARRPM